MEKLKDLYQKRRVFEEFNSEVPTELVEKIRRAESEIANRVCDTVIGSLPQPLEMPPGCSVVIGLEYRDGQLVKTASMFNASLEDKFENVNDLTVVQAEEPTQEHGEIVDGIRSKSIGFTVKFADGTTIRRSTAQQTMIEALRHMGLEQASHYRNEMFMDFPLVGKKQRLTQGKRWQQSVDGWWVYTNMSNQRKIKCLKGVAKMLNIDLEIISDPQ